MNASFLSPSRWRYWIIAAMLPVAAAAAEGELDLTGVYDDEGTVISTAGSAADAGSLHAMLSLEFVPALARILHEQTAQVRIKHGRDALEIAVIGRDDKVVWQGRWTEGEVYAIREGRAILHFKPRQVGRDEFLLIFRNITAHRLLELEVQRLTPTVLGPSIHQIGTYVFPRLPDEAAGDEKN